MKTIKVLALAILATTITFAPAQAAQIEEPDANSGNVTVEADREVDSTLITAGNRIDIRGLIKRNAILAGSTIQIENDIGADVIAAGQNISVRQKVEGDVIAAGQNIDIEDSATIGGDVIAFGAEVIVNGTISGNLRVYAAQVTINGSVFGNIDLGAANLTLGNEAVVGGNIKGQLENPINRAESAQVNGIIDVTNTPMDNTGNYALAAFSGFAASVFSKVFAMLMTLVLGLALYLLMPKLVSKIRQNTNDNTVTQFLVGLVTSIVAFPIMFGLLIFVVSMPIAAVLGLLLMIAWIVGSVFGYMWVGDLISSKKWTPMLTLLAGASLITVLKLIPFFGGIIGLFISLVGFGSVLSFSYRLINKEFR